MTASASSRKRRVHPPRRIGNDETVCQPARTQRQRFGGLHHTVARRNQFGTAAADVGNHHRTGEISVCRQAAERQAASACPSTTRTSMPV